MVLFPTSELSAGIFSTYWASVLVSPPPQVWTKGTLVPMVPVCPPPPRALQAEAFPLPAACPGLCFSSSGQRQSLFFLPA